jgi:hypothetical protein
MNRKVVSFTCRQLDSLRLPVTIVFVCWSFLVAGQSRCRVGGVQLGRPQPARRERARTYELDADERRRDHVGSRTTVSIPAPWVGSLRSRAVCGCRSGLTSTHSAPCMVWRVAMTVVASSCRRGEHAPGLVTLPVYARAPVRRGPRASCSGFSPVPHAARRRAGGRRGSAACVPLRPWRSSCRAVLRSADRWRRTRVPLRDLRRLHQHPPYVRRALL